MTINKDTIYTDYFEKTQNNNLKQIGVKESIKNFIDFNLLKQYSIQKRINNSTEYLLQLKKESEKFKDSIYYSQEIVEPLLRDYYKKLKTERKVQLLLLKKELLNEKNIDKYINTLLKQINNNIYIFEKEVEKYSTIQKYKKPVYIDVFSLEKPLMDTIYNAPLNHTTIFKAIDGKIYFILVSEERQYLGNVVLDEIYINNSSENGKNEADLIYSKIKNPEDFLEAKNKYSKHTDKENSFYTDINNDTLYNYVKNVHEPTVFPPIKTNDGFKIYKYIFRDNFEDYNTSKNRIFENLKKSIEVNTLNDHLIQELKQKSFFKEDIYNIKKFQESLPGTYENFQKMELENEKILVLIGNDIKFTDKELLKHLKQIPKEQYPNVVNFSQYILNEWENQAIINYYNSHFYEIDRNKEFYNNLENQLLIKFALKNITKDAQADIEGQQEFLKTHSDRLIWKERIQGTLYYCLNSEVEKKVLQMLNTGKSTQEIGNYFKGKTDSEKNVLLVINQGKYTRESVNLPTEEKLLKKIYTTDYKTGKLIIYINNIIKNDKMTLKELQTMFINEYIDYKIDTVMQQLKNEVVIHIDNLQEDYLIRKYGL
ncbi:hypothetical protein [Apibacter adventoris]|uniref:Peptidylprolyl isomerase n=1 Tax=Apibacter adventoris TaxID=1679466 RepID=A0A2S8AAU9_9FLAO|nr:hypothetical protein [Apibacter adventoris]PQL91684.1 hypothetical protein C4S77_07745 [Apibacter adventoris]